MENQVREWQRRSRRRSPQLIWHSSPALQLVNSGDGRTKRRLLRSKVRIESGNLMRATRHIILRVQTVFAAQFES